jgi:hypothetical protein
MHVAVEDSHNQIDHHPLRSSHYNDNGSSSNDSEYSYGAINDNNDDESVASNYFSVDSSGSSDDFDNANWFLIDYEEAQQQQITAASKLQIKLNHLINNHKAPLKLYDDIVDLFNE